MLQVHTAEMHICHTASRSFQFDYDMSAAVGDIVRLRSLLSSWRPVTEVRRTGQGIRKDVLCFVQNTGRFQNPVNGHVTA
jgi:hypothetical protein